MKRYSTFIRPTGQCSHLALRALVVALSVLSSASFVRAESKSKDVRAFFEIDTTLPGFSGLINPLRGEYLRRAVTWKDLLSNQIKNPPVGRYGLHWITAPFFSTPPTVPGDPRLMGGAVAVMDASYGFGADYSRPVGPSLNLRIRTGSTATYEFSGGIDRFTLGNIVRRRTIDGFEYEALPVTVERNGGLWLTHYLGYRMGRVAGQSASAVPAADREHYDLVTLPAPIVEGVVAEYVLRTVVPNSPYGHFFYAASEAERALLDEQDDWMRTGREFKSGGYLPVCRFFYRPPSGGAATHFYTAKADECERFKTQPGFTYEGTPFRASLPVAGNCPVGSEPLWRYYNQPTNAAVAPNHRYLSAAGDLSAGSYLRSATVAPWSREDIAFCVPE